MDAQSRLVKLVEFGLANSPEMDMYLEQKLHCLNCAMSITVQSHDLVNTACTLIQSFADGCVPDSVQDESFVREIVSYHVDNGFEIC